MSAVFLFHRDLRLADNNALNRAIKSGSSVLPVFVLDPVQIDASKNQFFSHPSVQFMCESLGALNAELVSHGSQLIIAHGHTLEVLSRLHKTKKFTNLYSNRDFSVFAKHRDAEIQTWCSDHSVVYTDCEDYDIVPLERVLMNEGTPGARPYTVLSHYYNKFMKDVYAHRSLVPKPETAPITPTTFLSAKELSVLSDVRIDELEKFYVAKSTLVQKGGRLNGLKQLARVAHIHAKYGGDRHFPGKPESTTQLSSHLKFGTISVREFFHTALEVSRGSLQSELIREIVFRSFYYKIWVARPELQRDSSFHQLIDEEIPWIYPKDSPAFWSAWIAGKTGYPLADAGMRQLEMEGYVHGRARMVLATVACRYLLFDWRVCAQYFATKLTDYDPILNAAGWGFGCSLGENAQNIWRAPMNPMLQSKNYDPECEYIKKWIPELKNIPAKDIHDWSQKAKTKYPMCTYPGPIVDQKEVSRKATALWKDAARKIKPIV